MADVVFIDTSVLLCILDIPGKNQNRDPLVEEFKNLVTTPGSTLILPVATIIETGNHIAQLSEGGLRRHRMEALAKLLIDSSSATAPWVIGNVHWDRDFIWSIVHGLPHGALAGLVDLASQGVGVGDVSIVHEMERYRSSTNTPSAQTIRLWTLDHGLQAISPSS